MELLRVVARCARWQRHTKAAVPLRKSLPGVSAAQRCDLQVLTVQADDLDLKLDHYSEGSAECVPVWPLKR